MAQPLTQRSLEYNDADWRPLRQGVPTAIAWHRVPGQVGVGICRKWNTNCCKDRHCTWEHLCIHCLQTGGSHQWLELETALATDDRQLNIAIRQELPANDSTELRRPGFGVTKAPASQTIVQKPPGAGAPITKALAMQAASLTVMKRRMSPDTAPQRHKVTLNS
jgi:hypothetical protein